ncbi:hypothetical protein PoB_001918400 [Plakobranchus ocellatus]|uniref:Uncharacterized protein n=1 Tax=Plakobranchus ocellatus TaxID=259542 RepID=A0AAV3ZFL8_9GAST|nr:hypothetical protein PoB_001918400 [Plakobranchus ocellatus]
MSRRDSDGAARGARKLPVASVDPAPAREETDNAQSKIKDRILSWRAQVWLLTKVAAVMTVAVRSYRSLVAGVARKDCFQKDLKLKDELSGEECRELIKLVAVSPISSTIALEEHCIELASSVPV